MYVFLISFVFILTATQCRPSIDDIDSFDSNAESTSNTDWMFGKRILKKCFFELIIIRN